MRSTSAVSLHSNAPKRITSGGRLGYYPPPRKTGLEHFLGRIFTSDVRSARSVNRTLDAWSKPGVKGYKPLLALPYETVKQTYLTIARPAGLSAKKVVTGHAPNREDILNLAMLYPGFKKDSGRLRDQIDTARLQVHSALTYPDYRSTHIQNLRNAETAISKARTQLAEMQAAIPGRKIPRIIRNPREFSRWELDPFARTDFFHKLEQYRAVSAPLTEAETRPLSMGIRNAQARAGNLRAYIDQMRNQKVAQAPTIRSGTPSSSEQLVQFMGKKGKLATNPEVYREAQDPTYWGRAPKNEQGVPVEAFAHPPAVQDFVPLPIYEQWMHDMTEQGNLTEAEAHASLQQWLNQVWEARRKPEVQHGAMSEKIYEALHGGRQKPPNAPFIFPPGLQDALQEFLARQQRYPRG